MEFPIFCWFPSFSLLNKSGITFLLEQNCHSYRLEALETSINWLKNNEYTFSIYRNLRESSENRTQHSISAAMCAAVMCAGAKCNTQVRNAQRVTHGIEWAYNCSFICRFIEIKSYQISLLTIISAFFMYLSIFRGHRSTNLHHCHDIGRRNREGMPSHLCMERSHWL